MVEMQKRNAMRRQTIAPGIDTGAPVMQAPGAPRIAGPVSRASIEREKSVRKHYEDLKKRYGATRYTRHRVSEMDMAPITDTPITDVYTRQIRPKKPVKGVPLEPLVIAKEQREREKLITAEGIRAAKLDLSLQRDVALGQYHDQLDAYLKQQQAYTDYLDAERERKQRDYEARKYGHDSYESLMKAIREEKMIKRLNELGKELTDVQLEAQKAIREQTPPDVYTDILDAQKKRIADIERSLEQSFDITVPEAGDYLDYIGGVMSDRPSFTPPAPDIPDKPPTGYQVKEGPLAGWTLTAHPDFKLTTDKVEPFREPVPQPFFEQILYHHKPIFDTIRRDIKIGEKPIAPKFGVDSPLAMISYPVKSVIHDPISPIYRPFEGALELMVGVSQAPAAIKHYAKHPGEIPEIPGKFYTGLITQWDTAPHHLVIDTAVMTGGTRIGLQAIKPITTPLTAGVREASILARTPSEMRPFVKGTSRIGRYSKGVEVTLPKPPDLSAAANVGEQAKVVLETLKTEPHSLYGSIVETGQMPAITTLERSGLKYRPTPSDVDVFVAEPVKTAERMVSKLGPEYSIEGGMTVVKEVKPGLTAHAVDIHPFPAGYPGAPTAVSKTIPAGSDIIQAPKLPFDFMPKELLTVEGITQEHLYTQLQRKAASTIGRPEGFLRWKPGPPAHRTKDIASTLIDADHLITAQRQHVSELSGLKKLVEGRRLRKLEEGYDLLASSPIAQAALEEAKGVSKPSVSPLVVKPPSPSVSPVVGATGVGIAVRTVSPIVSPAVKTSPIISPTVSPTVSPAVKTSPIVKVSSPTIKPVKRSPIVSRKVSPITVSPVVESPTIKPPTPTSPTIKSPTPIPPVRVSPTVKSPTPVSPSPVSTPPKSPTVIRPPTLRPVTRRPPKRGEEEKKRGKSIWDEWLIHYADAPTPHAGLRSAYLRMPDTLRRGPIMIKNMQRMTIGKAPFRKIKPIVSKGPSLTFGRKTRRPIGIF